jgi:uridine phosphorylase
MYRELTATDHLNVIGIDSDALPDVALIVGAMAVQETGERFSAYLENPVRLRRFPCFVAEWRGMKVALGACFGGPMAAVLVHTWCGAGVPTVVQLGWYGALQHGTAFGDVIVPRHAERQDGTSDWYLPKGILADSTPALSEAITATLTKRDITVHEQAIYSTPALLAESREVIADWSRHGWAGVDMETAATFAVAKSFSADRAAALIRLDDLVTEEDSIAERMPRERRAMIRERERVVTEAVLEAVVAHRRSP